MAAIKRSNEQSSETSASDNIGAPLAISQTRETLGGTHVDLNRFANPAPLGFLSFGTSAFLLNLFSVHARGIQHQNIIIGTMMMFGGVGQFIAGIADFQVGNTLGATLFTSFAGFNIAYALMFIPSIGIMEAYIDPATGEPGQEFANALAMVIWGWFIVSVVFTAALTRSSLVLLVAIAVFDIEAILLATGLMINNEQVLLASSSFGFVVSALVYYEAAAQLFRAACPSIRLPTGNLGYKRE